MHSYWCGYPSEPCSTTCEEYKKAESYSDGYRNGRRGSSPYIKGLYTRIKNLKEQLAKTEAIKYRDLHRESVKGKVEDA